MSTHEVLIIGGGFGGLNAARALAGAAVKVTLVDRRNFHLFQPLLYQVATGVLSPANIAAPLREILRGQKNTFVLMDEVMGFDVRGRRVQLVDNTLPYDTLILAAGASHSYFGHDNWQTLAPGLKTVEDATEIRQRLLSAFEAAERSKSPEEAQRWLTFVIVGGGPTGVELAGALGEITRDTLRDNFRHINPASAVIHLIEGAPRVLQAYPPKLSDKAAKALRGLGVHVRFHSRVVDVGPSSVVVEGEDGQREEIMTRTVVWAAGVQATPLARALAEATGAAQDRAGRVIVDANMNVPGHEELFVIGDAAHLVDETARDRAPLPGVAPVAMQQGVYVGRLIAARLAGRRMRPFRYKDYGSMATIGRGVAVADMNGLRFAGVMAWFAWLMVHLLKLIGFQNKFLVVMQWAWNYVTRARAARLITGAVRH